VLTLTLRHNAEWHDDNHWGGPSQYWAKLVLERPTLLRLSQVRFELEVIDAENVHQLRHFGEQQKQIFQSPQRPGHDIQVKFQENDLSKLTWPEHDAPENDKTCTKTVHRVATLIWTITPTKVTEQTTDQCQMKKDSPNTCSSGLCVANSMTSSGHTTRSWRTMQISGWKTSTRTMTTSGIINYSWTYLQRWEKEGSLLNFVAIGQGR